MTQWKMVAVLAVGVLTIPAHPAVAQTTVEPANPRWGNSITVTVQANRGPTENQRIDPTEQLFAVLSPIQRGPSLSRHWTPMTWDGRQFVARMTVPQGCETGTIRAATAERVVEGAVAHFVCMASDGTRVPGALITSLFWGGRDRSTWKTDVSEDMAALRTTEDPGWAHAAVWAFRLGHEKGTFTKPELLADVQRVDREETRRTPGLLNSLARGYELAGQTETAFERLKELCDRFPDSEFTTRDALRLGTAAIVNRPEFGPELGRLLAQVAARSPANTGLRDLLPRLIKNVPAVPLPTLRQIAEGWMREHPDQMAPHFLLASALCQGTGVPEQEREAEALVSKRAAAENHVCGAHGRRRRVQRLSHLAIA